MKKLTLPLFFLFTLLFSCSKEEVLTEVSSKNSNNKSLKQSNYLVLSNYSKILTIGLNDVIKNETNRHIILNALSEQSNKGDQFDYKISLNDLSIIFNNNNKDLQFLMEQSIINNSINPEVDLNAFKQLGNKVKLGNYIHEFEIFFPAMNTDIYQSVNMQNEILLTTILYNLEYDYSFPIYNSSKKAFEIQPSNLLEKEPILILSAKITSLHKSIIEINTNPLLAAGRCSRSNSTGWCIQSGRGCKCEGGGPLERKEFVDLFISQIQ